jgi:hypothetical protein
MELSARGTVANPSLPGQSDRHGVLDAVEIDALALDAAKNDAPENDVLENDALENSTLEIMDCASARGAGHGESVCPGRSTSRNLRNSSSLDVADRQRSFRTRQHDLAGEPAKY